MRKHRMILFIILFMGFVPSIIFMYEAYKNLNIYCNKSKYQLSKMKVDSLYVGNGQKDSYVYAYGKIKNVNLKVYIGVTPYQLHLFNNSIANLNQDTIQVLYRKDARFPVFVHNKEKVDFDVFIKKCFYNMILPIIMIALLLFIKKNCQ